MEIDFWCCLVGFMRFKIYNYVIDFFCWVVVMKKMFIIGYVCRIDVYFINFDERIEVV